MATAWCTVRRRFHRRVITGPLRRRLMGAVPGFNESNESIQPLGYDKSPPFFTFWNMKIIFQNRCYNRRELIPALRVNFAKSDVLELWGKKKKESFLNWCRQRTNDREQQHRGNYRESSERRELVSPHCVPIQPSANKASWPVGNTEKKINRSTQAISTQWGSHLSEVLPLFVDLWLIIGHECSRCGAIRASPGQPAEGNQSVCFMLNTEKDCGDGGEYISVDLKGIY